MWNAAIVQRFESRDLSESQGKLLFSFSALSPCAGRLRLVGDGKGYISL
jgi:hypothetical protein